MPFDTLAAKKIIHVLEAHRNHPGGEIMLKAAEQLKAATDDAGNSMGQIRAAETVAAEAKGKYDGALLEIKALREKAPLLEGALTALREVATTKRGAQKIAMDFLAANNLAVSTEVKAP